MRLRSRKPELILRMGFGFLALVFLAFAPLVCSVEAQTKTQSPVPLPIPFTPIVDNAHVIDAATRQRLETIYLNLKQRADIEYAVLTVDTTGDLDIFDFSLAVARGWSIGSKGGDKAGFLLVVAIQDRKYFTQISDHLEGDLPDGLVGQIQRERLVPAFRQKNYSKGILDTMQAYVATLGAKRGFSIEGIDERYAYRGEERRSGESQSGGMGSLCLGILFILFILILVFSASRRGRGGGGCLQALLWGSLFSNLGGGGRRGDDSSSGWGRGGFGGDGGSGGGGGGFGGGFGGGGSFGGGGAGGSW